MDIMYVSINTPSELQFSCSYINTSNCGSMHEPQSSDDPQEYIHMT